jgi:hypothetical protein
MGAWYGLSGAPGVPLEWLDGTPFRSYRFPSIILGGAVGGGAIVAAAITLGAWGAEAALIGAVVGVILVAWIVVQVRMIGSVHWLQPVSLAYGLVVCAIGILTYVRAV